MGKREIKKGKFEERQDSLMRATQLKILEKIYLYRDDLRRLDDCQNTIPVGRNKEDRAIPKAYTDSEIASKGSPSNTETLLKYPLDARLYQSTVARLENVGSHSGQSLSGHPSESSFIPRSIREVALSPPVVLVVCLFAVIRVG